MSQQAEVRLYALLARKSPVGVVFRRGPSKQVLLVHWRTDTDIFQLGQWFKGRIYERRCDLSPSGEKLIYFAAKHRGDYGTWTAISRPPFWTALALWPKGDAWGGGGLFEKENRVLLNHPADEMALAKGFSVPKKFEVRPFGAYSGRGEDSPILGAALAREGWAVSQEGVAKERLGAQTWITFDPPAILSKPRRDCHERWGLQRILRGIHERGGPWYVIEHVVVDKQARHEHHLGRTDWADWDHSGELVFAREGRLFRLGFDSLGSLRPLQEAKELIDLRPLTFQRCLAPEEATSWNGELRLS